MVRAAAIVLALLAAPAAHAARCPAPGATISAAHFTKLARGAEPVRLHGVDVRGTVRLGQTNVPVSCRGCAFDALVLRDAVINRVLDLRGLRGLASLDATGAEFRQPVLIGTQEGCDDGRASFFFATFDDSADFEGTSFDLANLGQARFRRTVSFGHVWFDRPVSFAGATFEADAGFDDAWFKRLVVFTGASFSGRAHFLRTTFGGQPCSGRGAAKSADFTSASFGGPAELAQSWFCGEATFQRTRFDGGASFLGAQFLLPVPPVVPMATPFAVQPAKSTRCDPEHPPDTGLIFDHVSAAGRLDFGSALFNGTPVFLGVAAHTLSLEDAAFDRCVPLQLSGLESIEDLRLSPADTAKVDDVETRIQVLRAVGASAAARDDLAVANDAHYRLLELTSEREGPVRRTLDHVFYRDVAGYLVRPFQPLLWLLGLAVAASLFRAVRSRPRDGTSVGRVRTPGRGEVFVHGINRFLTELGRTLSPTQRAGPDAPLGRKVEGAVYVVLLACFVIGLANSNPTLKQLVDAIL